MDTAPLCPSCGKPLAPGAPKGLCPACLLKAGFATGTETGQPRTPFVPPRIEEIAAKFPQLEILSLIGSGGMGAVYKARQKQLERVVALKILPPEISEAPAFAERFAREARALARLNHPGIVTLYEFGQADGLFFFLMEFVDGVNLRQLLNAGRVAPREALAIVPQICDALQYAHDQGIVHRDIKPENILLDRRGHVKVADFGIARLVGAENQVGESSDELVTAEVSLTEVGKTVGTPNYMAPEQRAQPASVDHRADIYSLGVVLYQMLTGELPGRRIEPPAKKLHLDVRLDEIVLRALEREPERRYQQASQFKTQVETLASNLGGGESPENSAEWTNWEKRAPAWRIRCRKCGFTEHWGKYGIRLKAVGNSNVFGRCPHCKRLGWQVIEPGKPEATPDHIPTPPPPRPFRWVRFALWVFFALWLLNFVAPHSVRLGPNKIWALTIGGSQPWLLYLSHSVDGMEPALRINPRSSGFVSGLVALAIATFLFLSRAKAVGLEKDRRQTILRAVGISVAVLIGLLLVAHRLSMYQFGRSKSLLRSEEIAVAPSPASRLPLPIPPQDVATVASASQLAEAPRLRFVAWQDEWLTNHAGAPRHPDGSPVTNVTEVKWVTTEISPSREDVSALNIHPEPRFLYLWISHPAFDRNMFSEVSLLDEQGKQLLSAAGGSSASGSRKAEPFLGNIGWLTHTISPVAGTNVPTKATVRLRYTVGPLENTHDVEVTPKHTSMSLEGNSQFSGIGQNVDGEAFMTVAASPELIKTRRFGAAAITKDGRDLVASGGSISGIGDSAGVRVESFEFEVPLSQVAKFRIGTRPIRTVEWMNVVLPP